MITRKFDIEPDKLREEFAKRAKLAGQQIGRTLAANTTAVVKERLGGLSGGWYDIYKAAINYFESDSGTEWAVAGYGAVPPALLPAATTLIDFDAKSEASTVLQAYNPWVLDAVPPLLDGIDANIVVRPATVAAVMDERARLVGLLPFIYRQLMAKKLSLLPEGTSPAFAGQVYVDVVFLASRLELGLGGFPRVPHWSTAAFRLEAQGKHWGEQTAPAVDQILAGGPLTSAAPRVLSATEMEQLGAQRKASWEAAP